MKSCKMYSGKSLLWESVHLCWDRDNLQFTEGFHSGFKFTNILIIQHF